jgi:hypothetical protein
MHSEFIAKVEEGGVSETTARVSSQGREPDEESNEMERK